MAHKFEGTILFDAEGKAVRVVGVLSGHAVPGVPLDVRVTQFSDDFVDLVWTDAGDALSWKIMRSTEGGAFVQIDTSTVPAYTDGTVANDTDYEYAIIATNAAGDSGQSTAAAVHTTGQSVPDAPTGLSDGGDTTAFRVELTWDFVEGVLEWDVFRNGVYFDTVSTPEFVDTTVASSSTYTYAVIARNASGDSLPASLVITTEANEPPQWFVTSPSYDLTVGTGFSLDFAGLAGDPDGLVLSFSIFAGSIPAGMTFNSNGQLSGVPSTAATYTPTVRASDGVNSTDLQFTFVVAAVADTTAPTNPGVTSVVSGSTVTHTLTTPSTDASGIAFYRCQRDGVTVNSNVIFPWTETNVPNGSHTYAWRAFDASPNQNFTAFVAGLSNPVVVSVTTNPDTPINFQLTGVSSSQINSSWAAGPNGPAPTLYRLERSATGANPQAAPGTNGWTTSYAALSPTSDSDTGLTISTQYFYRLRAEITAGGLVSAWVFGSAFTTGSTLIIAQGSDNPRWPHGAGSMTLTAGNTRFSTWETWMGHPMEIYTEWFSQNTSRTWADLAGFNAGKVKDAINFFQSIGRHTIPIVMRTPILPNDDGPDSNKKLINPSTWDRAAAGNYTTYFTQLAQAVALYCTNHGRAPNSIIWSLGWEFTGDWYPWAMGTKYSQYRTYFGLIVDAIRAVIPGARVDWPPARDRGAGNPSLATIMPDPSKFDYISRSAHDGPVGNFVQTSQPQNWVNQRDGTSSFIGLLELVNLARSLGKKFVLSEWASQIDVSDPPDNHGPAPDPAQYYQKMYDEVLNANWDVIGYDTMFQPNDCQLYSRTGPATGVAARNMVKSKWHP